MFCTNLQSPVWSSHIGTLVLCQLRLGKKLEAVSVINIWLGTVCSNPKLLLLFSSGGTVTAFALTTCTAASIRETDDPTNWAIGGAASAVFMGLASKLFFCILMLIGSFSNGNGDTEDDTL